MNNDLFGFCADCDDNVPSKKEMIKNLANSAKDIITGMFTEDGLNIYVSEETYQYRMDMCSGCEFFQLHNKRCIKCGCFMEVKAEFKKTECPIGKWGKNE